MTAAAWLRAEAALALLAIDPAGLGGLALRARAGPARDRLLAGLAPPLPLRRLHPAIGDEALYGGLDLAAALASGRAVRRAGLLDSPAALLLPMAERATAGLAARLAAALDGGLHCLIALDEAATPEEGLAPALAERLGLAVGLDGIALGETREVPAEDHSAARARLAGVAAPPEALADLARLAARLGIGSLRAPHLALRAARAAAARAGRETVGEADLLLAAELVLAPRATVLPAPEEDAEQETPEPPPPEDEAERGEGDSSRPPDDVLLEAVRALLPPDLLARIAMGRARARAAGAGAGEKRKGARRGRPLPSRPGRLGAGAALDLSATLRAAAPWQRLRAKPEGARLAFRAEDIRLRRYEERAERLLLFAVDASGSAAFSRLAEAKGAVELLLAEAYARRDQVALIGFRGAGAEILLPPTRSLVRAKKALASLPGGGGTPLAAGLRAALALALSERGKGRSPALALLTDGRANIALSGAANRTEAAADALALARALRARALPGIVIDAGARPEPQLAALAREMGAAYLPLPRADSARIAGAVAAALGA